MIRVSDASAWEHCPRHAWYQLHPPAGAQMEPNPFETLIQALGEAHERTILDSFDAVATATSAVHTLALIADRAPVIYQPQFVDAVRGVVGNPDFLILKDRGYQVGDAKLSLSLEGKKAIKAQLGVYRQLADSALPAIVFLGNGETDEVTDKDAPIAEQFLADMAALDAMVDPPDTHYAYSKCSPCPFQPICVPAFKAADEITLNPAVEVRARPGLVAQGISTLTALAKREVDAVDDVPYLKGADKKRRAILQARSLTTGEVFTGGDIQLPQGTCVHFDAETDPLAHGGAGQVYLWGLLAPPYDEAAFEYIWKMEEDDGDIVAWQTFLDRMTAYRDRLGDRLLIVHYSDYEVIKIRQYATRYGMEDNPIVQWLLSDEGPLVDLMKIVKNNLILPVYSYGLKAICKDHRLVNFQWQQAESGSQWSVVRYYDYLAADDPAEAERIKNEIVVYNFDDVRATAALWEWIDKRH